jgi:hypothetical protein
VCTVDAGWGRCIRWVGSVKPLGPLPRADVRVIRMYVLTLLRIWCLFEISVVVLVVGKGFSTECYHVVRGNVVCSQLFCHVASSSAGLQVEDGIVVAAQPRRAMCQHVQPMTVAAAVQHNVECLCGISFPVACTTWLCCFVVMHVCLGTEGAEY